LDALLAEREHMARGLSEIGSLTVFPSDANFILFRVEQEAGAVFKKLMEKGILVRNLSGHPRLRNCLRVTIGTPDENRAFLEQMSHIIK